MSEIKIGIATGKKAEQQLDGLGGRVPRMTSDNFTCCHARDKAE